MSSRRVTKDEVRAVTKTVEVLCDVCGVKSKAPHKHHYDSVEWDNHYDVDVVGIYHAEGQAFPDGGSRTAKYADVCPK